MITAQELAIKAAKAKPHIRYAYDKNDNAVGAYDSEVGRFVCVAGKLLTGEWAHMPTEPLINGEPTKREWIEVSGDEGENYDRAY